MSKQHKLKIFTPPISQSPGRNELIKAIGLLQQAALFEKHRIFPSESQTEYGNRVFFTYTFRDINQAKDIQKQAKALGLNAEIIPGKKPEPPPRQDRWSTEAYRKPPKPPARALTGDSEKSLLRNPSGVLKRIPQQPLPLMKYGRPILAQ